MALTIRSKQVRYVNNTGKTLDQIKQNLAGEEPCIVFGKISDVNFGIWIWNGTEIKSANEYDKDTLSKYIFRALDQYINPDTSSSVLTPTSDGKLDITKNVIFDSTKIDQIKSKLN